MFSKGNTTEGFINDFVEKVMNDIERVRKSNEELEKLNIDITDAVIELLNEDFKAEFDDPYDIFLNDLVEIKKIVLIYARKIAKEQTYLCLEASSSQGNVLRKNSG